MTEIQTLRATLQAAFDGRLPCVECGCLDPCERLAALGVVRTQDTEPVTGDRFEVDGLGLAGSLARMAPLR